MQKRGVRLIGCAALVAATWVVGSALASSLSTSSQTTGAGNASVPRCDTDGVSTLFVLSGSDVASVTVSGIASGCAGKTLDLTITNGTVTRTGSATVPAGGGQVSVTLSSTIPVTNPNVLQTDIKVT